VDILAFGPYTMITNNDHSVTRRESMRRFQLPRTIALMMTCALALAASARMLRADDAAPSKEPAAGTPAAEAPQGETTQAPEAPKTEVAPASEMYEDVKLIKVDAEAKTVTVLIAPDKSKSGRAYKQMKFSLDDNSLVMVDQQPSSMAALQKGMIVNLSHFKKGKVETVDTIIVVKAAEE
jgi:hypothetical protein